MDENDEASSAGSGRAIASEIEMSGRERLLIGGDFNANLGRGNARRGVSGKYEAGRGMIDRCEEQGWAYVDSFMKHARRRTWFNSRYGRWYEFDGFLVRKNERHWMIERIRTMTEWSLSDHRPKLVRARKDVKK